MKLGKSEEAVLDYLKKQEGYVSPTSIGRVVGGYTSRGLPRHSSWASPICKRLVNRGLVQRNEKGWYQYINKNRYALK